MNNRLMSIKKEELVNYYHFIVANLFSNVDVLFAFYEDKKLPKYFKEIIKRDNIELMNIDKEKMAYILKVHQQNINLTKKEYIELIDYIFNTEEILEAFCIAYIGNNDSLVDFIEMLGYKNKYEVLKEDEIFVYRRRYINLITKYIKAATNLYGVINVAEVFDIINMYEKLKNNPLVFKRNSGNYKESLFASCKYFSVPILYTYGQSFASNIILTNDGFFLSPVFTDEYRKEIFYMKDNMKKLMLNFRQYTNAMRELEKKYSYRKLYNEVLDKHLYLPKKDLFLNYADADYLDDSEALKVFEEYLLETFINRLKLPKEFTVLQDESIISEAILKDLAVGMAINCSDHNENISTSVAKSGEELYGFLNTFGVRIKKDEKIQIALLLNVLSDNVRNWRNRGFTNDELDKMDQMGDLFFEEYLNEMENEENSYDDIFNEHLPH